MGPRIVQFLKMSWMLFWRIGLISVIFTQGKMSMGTVFLIAAAISAISVFGFNRSLAMWPIARRLFRGGSIFINAGERNVRPQSTQPRGNYNYGNNNGSGSTTSTTRIANRQKIATNNGRLTGFEPRELASLPVPRSYRMSGTPGGGLHNSGFSRTNVNLGVQGEENFAKALHKANLIDKIQTVWSVAVPQRDLLIPDKSGADIDVIAATGTALFLIDIKNYKSGDVTYTRSGNELYCTDNATGNQVGDIKEMSRNMSNATNMIRHHFPGVNVVPVVVFMPTDKGEGVIDNVTWPGDIPAMNLTELLDILSGQNPVVSGSPENRAAGQLVGLIKGNSSLV